MKRARTEQSVRPIQWATCNGHQFVEDVCKRCGQYQRNQGTPKVDRITPRIRLLAGGWHCYDKMPLLRNGGSA